MMNPYFFLLVRLPSWYQSLTRNRANLEDEEQEQTDEVPRGTTFLLSKVTHVNTGFLSYFKARIKKIMQKDEEVGKVAQATPIVICTCSKLLSCSC